MAASGSLLFGTVYFTWIAHVVGCLDTRNRTRIPTRLSVCRYFNLKPLFVFAYVLINIAFSSTGYSFFVFWFDVLPGSSLAVQA